MFYVDTLLNRPAAIRNMCARDGYNSTMQNLLRTLSNTEIKTLQKNPDLIDRVSQICKMGSDDFLEVLEQEFMLYAESANFSGEFWVLTSGLEKRLPKGWKDSHVGWCFPPAEPGEVYCVDFPKFARLFLLQEVQINLWIRYIEDKKGKSKLPPAVEVDPRLAWGGYGI